MESRPRNRVTTRIAPTVTRRAVTAKRRRYEHLMAAWCTAAAQTDSSTGISATTLILTLSGTVMSTAIFGQPNPCP